MPRLTHVIAATLIAQALSASTTMAGPQSRPACKNATSRFAYLDGVRGHLDLLCGNEGVLHLIKVFTVQRNTHVCTLSPTESCVVTTGGATPSIEPSCLESKNVDQLCQISIRIDGDTAYVRYVDGPCSNLCGAKGDFEGEYRLQRRTTFPPIR
jgi:hypothetical protein